MTENDPSLYYAVGIAVAVPIIGVIMALKWKWLNFKGSPSKGGYFVKSDDKKSDE